jgi:hypothetical protein
MSFDTYCVGVNVGLNPFSQVCLALCYGAIGVYLIFCLPQLEAIFCG